MAMILAKVAPMIRPARIASSLIPFSIPHPRPPPLPQSQHSPVAISYVAAVRTTPSLFRLPYDFSGKVRLGSFQMLRQMSTRSSSSDEEKLKMEKIFKSTEATIRRICENQEQSKKVDNLIYALNVIKKFCEVVVVGLGAAYLWNICDKQERVIMHTGRKKDVK